MKSTFSFFTFVLTLAFFTSCSNAPEGQKVDAEEAKTEATAAAEAVSYTVDTEASVIRWTGAKPTGQHMGTVNVSGGSLAVADGNITAGEFTIDFASLAVTDLQAGQGKEDLEGHLKTGDFFEVEKFPTGTFTVTSVDAVEGEEGVTHKVTGNLTMKGITKSVSIPANVAVMGDKISAQSTDFTIDRTEWGITYNSGTLATAKDKIINDEVGLVVTLVANK